MMYALDFDVYFTVVIYSILVDACDTAHIFLMITTLSEGMHKELHRTGIYEYGYSSKS